MSSEEKNGCREAHRIVNLTVTSLYWHTEQDDFDKHPPASSRIVGHRMWAFGHVKKCHHTMCKKIAGELRVFVRRGRRWSKAERRREKAARTRKPTTATPRRRKR